MVENWEKYCKRMIENGIFSMDIIYDENTFNVLLLIRMSNGKKIKFKEFNDKKIIMNHIENEIFDIKNEERNKKLNRILKNENR